MLVENFACFRDESRLEGKRVRFYKRAQILVADLWACFCGLKYGAFDDIDQITMFAGMSMFHQAVTGTDYLRLSRPSNAIHLRMSEIQSFSRLSYSTAQIHRTWAFLGGADPRLQYLVCGAVAARNIA